MSRSLLRRGDLLPRVITELPGPRCRDASRQFAELEAPGINTLFGGAPNLVWQEALGSCVSDLDGNRFLDFTAGFGVAAIGHRHPRVVAALQEQSRHLIHGLGDAMGHPGRLELAARLRQLAPWPEAARTQVYFAVSGADAIEVALKTALLHHRGRSAVAFFEPSYHGLSLGALAATSRPSFRDPFAAHLHREWSRFPFGGPLEGLRKALQGGTFAAVLAEPVVGREGVLLPPVGWLTELAALCRETDTLLIFDEIFTGFGRTGHLFAAGVESVTPDILCCGKALGGGLPIAAMLAPQKILAAWSTPGEALHTGTFVANPLACAAALASLAVIEEEGLVARARSLGDSIAPRLASWLDQGALVAVRGRGLLYGLEFRSRSLAGRFQQAAWRQGILLLAGGPEGRVAQLVPPLSIEQAQLEAALEALELALATT